MSTVSTLFKISEDQDKKMYDTMSNCKEKTAFIKNALFYYIHNIERGIVVDRLYPYDELTDVRIEPRTNIDIYQKDSLDEYVESMEDDTFDEYEDNFDVMF